MSYPDCVSSDAIRLLQLVGRSVGNRASDRLRSRGQVVDFIDVGPWPTLQRRRLARSSCRDISISGDARLLCPILADTDDEGEAAN